MQSITKTYLTDIVFRAISETINTRRVSQKNNLFYLDYPTPTEEEVADFIQSIPYFDKRLKNFLLGELDENTTIISQAWETAFIVKCKTWAKSDDWLHVDMMLFTRFYGAYAMIDTACLTLPY